MLPGGFVLLHGVILFLFMASLATGGPLDEPETVHYFPSSPTITKLDECTKPELLLIAKVFKADVNAGANKAEIKQSVMDKLIEKGIIDGASEPAVIPSVRPRVHSGQGVDEAVASPPSYGTKVSPTTPDKPSEGDPGGLELALRLREVELQMKTQEVELLRLRNRAAELDRLPNPRSTIQGTSPPSQSSSVSAFDITKHLALVPHFKEAEIDSYFDAFERIATIVKWPQDVWSLLLQTKLVGKAREVCAALSMAQSLDYGTVKETILRAYELVPEAYRQRFRSCEKSANQTHGEFAREKAVLFDKWCSASNVKSMHLMRELVLLEEFKSCLPERVVLYLNEQKVDTLAQAAVRADEFMLTHKSVFPSPSARRDPVGGKGGKKFSVLRNPLQSDSSGNSGSSESRERECFYCHEKGHLIKHCSALKRKENSSPAKPKTVGFIKSISPPRSPVAGEMEECFGPFLTKGSVSLSGQDVDQVPITILRDTGASQSLILNNVLPFSAM